jgi:hypothetical protein
MAEPKHSLYRAIHHMRRGGLHRALGVSENDKIPAEKIEAATHSSNGHIAHMANFAQTLKGLHKK